MKIDDKELYDTQKGLAKAMGRSRWYVAMLQENGLKLPCTIAEVVTFLRKTPLNGIWAVKRKRK